MPLKRKYYRKQIKQFAKVRNKYIYYVNVVVPMEDVYKCYIISTCYHLKDSVQEGK